MSDDSEFICNVVRITAVNKHPNADRLDLVDISLDDKNTYPHPIVAAKDEWKAGDLAIYVGPDSVVPISEGSAFDFLRTRLDAKKHGEYKTHYRVRSANIRGHYSPGLLIKVPSGERAVLGDSYAKALGVVNYELPVHTVETMVNGERVRGNVPSTRFPVYSVTSLKKVPSLFTEGEDVLVTEKIHGTNFRFGYGCSRCFFFGTHRTALVDTRGFWSRVWDRIRGRNIINSKPGFGNPWGAAVKEWQLEAACKSFPDYVFYGELYGVHNGAEVQKGFSYGHKALALAIFDVYDWKQKRWLTSEERFDAVWDLGLPMVPRIYHGPFNWDIIKERAEMNSYHGGIREGVVVESTDPTKPRRKGKWVSDRYYLTKEKDDAAQPNT